MSKEDTKFRGNDGTTNCGRERSLKIERYYKGTPGTMMVSDFKVMVYMEANCM